MAFLSTVHGMSVPSLYILCLILISIALGYVLYQYLLHPLARFPGPFWANFSGSWRFVQIFYDQLPKELMRLHDQKSSSVLRVGPNALHFNHPDSVAQIYKRGWSKTNYYKSFEGPGETGLFNETDESYHGKKRRMVAPVFATKALREMEDLMDSRYAVLRRQLDRFSETGEKFDLKRYITYCIADILGELAFGKAFGCQDHEDPSHIPPISEVIWIGATKGSIPDFAGLCSRLLSWWIFENDKQLNVVRDLAAQRIVERLESHSERPDMLGKILSMREGKTGEEQSLETVQEISAELIIGGTHSTGTSLHFIIANLSRNPDVLKRVVEEIDTNLSPLAPGQAAFGVTGLEEKLDYLHLSIRESFRKNPASTFDMPRLVPHGGAEIAGHYIPGGTEVSANLMAIGRNKAIWGPDVEVYDPDRWLKPENKALQHLVTPWSTGKRSCVGQNFAHLNILKMLTTLFRCYEFNFFDTHEPIHTITHGGTSLRNPIMVTVKRRGDSFQGVPSEVG